MSLKHRYLLIAMCVGLTVFLGRYAQAGVTISSSGSFSIVWEGTSGDYFNPDNPAPVTSSGNLATETGATAFGSSAYPAAAHIIPHVNDGYYGNINSWLAADSDTSPYIAVSFGGERLINGIAWGRDNGNSVDTGQTGGYPTGQYADRWINTYGLQYTLVAGPGTSTIETGDPTTGWADLGSVTYDSTAQTGFTGYLRNQYSISSVAATAVRIKPGAIINGQSAIDELEVFGGTVSSIETGGSLMTNNVAAQSAGGVAFAKDVIGGYASHAIDHLNDETYGNTHSWIGNSVNSFAGVAFDDAYAIDQIAFGRDNGDPPGEANQYVDRYAGIYTLQYTMAEIGTVDETLADSEWITIANLTYDSTSPDTTGYLRHLWNFPRIDGVTGIRILTASSGDAIAIDEIEVHGVPEPSTVMMMLGAAFGGLLLVRRRNARAKAH